MHLAEARGCDGRQIEILECNIHGSAEIFFDDTHDLARVVGRNLILKLADFGEVGLG